jgi:AcrR family transcriptional regulator
MHSAIDLPAGPAWSALGADGKRDRLLAAAERVFAEGGLDAPMPAVARAAGASIGSLYRQFASKDDLVAALAERRLATLEAELDHALADAGAWAGLQAFLWRALGQDASDDVSAKAIASASSSAAVQQARERVHGRIEQLVTRAREQGDLRADATRLDVSLVIVAARSVRHLHPNAWRRMVELAIDGLRASPREAGRARTEIA